MVVEVLVVEVVVVEAAAVGGGLETAADKNSNVHFYLVNA